MSHFVRQLSRHDRPPVDSLGEIPPGTTQLTALVFKYTIYGPPLTGEIRNIARVKITNHSGQLGTPFGPEPKASWTGGAPPHVLPQRMTVLRVRFRAWLLEDPSG